MKEKIPIISITAKDCNFDYFRGSGTGGQHRNKTSSAVRCTHVPSGAVGKSEDTRSQHQNKKLAFKRMAQTKLFQNWVRIQSLITLGKLKYIDDDINNEKNLLIEVKDENGNWRPQK